MADFPVPSTSKGTRIPRAAGRTPKLNRRQKQELALRSLTDQPCKTGIVDWPDEGVPHIDVGFPTNLRFGENYMKKKTAQLLQDSGFFPVTSIGSAKIDAHIDELIARGFTDTEIIDSIIGDGSWAKPDATGRFGPEAIQRAMLYKRVMKQLTPRRIKRAATFPEKERLGRYDADLIDMWVCEGKTDDEILAMLKDQELPQDEILHLLQVANQKRRVQDTEKRTAYQHNAYLFMNYLEGFIARGYRDAQIERLLHQAHLEPRTIKVLMRLVRQYRNMGAVADGTLGGAVGLPYWIHHVVPSYIRNGLSNMDILKRLAGHHFTTFQNVDLIRLIIETRRTIEGNPKETIKGTEEPEWRQLWRDLVAYFRSEGIPMERDLHSEGLWNYQTKRRELVDAINERGFAITEEAEEDAIEEGDEDEVEEDEDQIPSSAVQEEAEDEEEQEEAVDEEDDLIYVVPEIRRRPIRPLLSQSKSGKQGPCYCSTKDYLTQYRNKQLQLGLEDSS